MEVQAEIQFIPNPVHNCWNSSDYLSRIFSNLHGCFHPFPREGLLY